MARASVAVLALAFCLLLLDDAAPARARPARAMTDAYTLVAPEKPWTAEKMLEPAGQLTFSAAGPGQAQALLRVSYTAVVPREPGRAIDDLLGREKAGIREDVDGRSGVERTSFEPDSMIGAASAGLRWRGFRVSVNTSDKHNRAWRWVALHPQFPSVRRAFTLSYDESAPAGAQMPGRLAAARALAASVLPVGRGLAGPLDEAWLDARAAAFAARIDSAQRLCWSHRADGAFERDHVGYGRGLAIEGDFFVLSSSVPADSLVDPAPAEYGTAFDRNGDGRLDLILVNRGLQTFGEGVLQATVAVFADDDFDGRIDALVFEDLDGDADRRVDGRLLARDANGDGRVDDARSFRGATGADAPRLKVEAGRVRARRAGLPSETSDFVETFRMATQRLGELDRARAACIVPP